MLPRTGRGRKVSVASCVGLCMSVWVINAVCSVLSLECAALKCVAMG